MRPLLFLVADKNMAFALRGLPARRRWCESIEGAGFASHPDSDFVVAAGHNDPGSSTKSAGLFYPFAGRCRYVVVMLDASWDHAPGADLTRQTVERHIRRAGWPQERGFAAVFDPEVDVRMRLDSPHAAHALGSYFPRKLRQALVDRHGLVPENAANPANPEEASGWASGTLRKAESGRARPPSTKRWPSGFR